MTTERFVQIQPLAGTLSTRPVPAHAGAVATEPGKTCGIDVGSTTCKFVLVSHDGQLLAQAYERHNTKQAEKVLDFLIRLESEHSLTPQLDLSLPSLAGKSFKKSWRSRRPSKNFIPPCDSSAKSVAKI